MATTAQTANLVTRLQAVIEQLEMAAEDAGEDFAAGMAHAEIAMGRLEQIVAWAKLERAPARIPAMVDNSHDAECGCKRCHENRLAC